MKVTFKELRQIWPLYDTDGSGEIDMEEWLAMVTMSHADVSKAKGWQGLDEVEHHYSSFT